MAGSLRKEGADPQDYVIGYSCSPGETQDGGIYVVKSAFDVEEKSGDHCAKGVERS